MLNISGAPPNSYFIYIHTVCRYFVYWDCFQASLENVESAEHMGYIRKVGYFHGQSTAYEASSRWLLGLYIALIKSHLPQAGPRKKLNFRYLLNQRESKALRFVKNLYKKRFQTDPMKDEHLFAFLGDNPEKRLCWSATSRKVPTFRMNTGRMYHVPSDTWMTGRDKLACLGLPVSAGQALAMGVPILPVSDPQRASKVAGNSFHFSSVSVVALVALVCFTPTANTI